jgi:hypothetical protein
VLCNYNKNYSWQIISISWAANFAAHMLDKVVVEQVIDKIWLEQIYSYVCNLVSLEQSAIISWSMNETKYLQKQ